MHSSTDTGGLAESAAHLASTPQLALGLHLPDCSAFENFHAGPNEQALPVVRQLSEGQLRGVVYLCGPGGSGKSHLLQAACRHAHGRGRRTLYLPLKRFQPLGGDALEGLDRLDLLVLDGVDAMAGEPEAETALFHLVRRVLDREGCLLVSAPVAPSGVEWRLPDLASRLASGPVIRLQPLDDEGRALALRLRARHRGMDLSEEAARYLLRRHGRAPAELFSLLDELDAASLAAQRRLTIPFLREALAARQARAAT